jgi:peptidyl-prolyl cis-trans isomerase C
MREWCRAAIKEPLVHFLVGGLAVFLIFAIRGEEADPESRRIIITTEMAGKLAARFEQTMQRQPTPAEMDGIIRDHIREEIYYREAMRLGLDADDDVIRRRLRSKMEYLARAEAEAATPDDATLQAWLNRNAARYAPDAIYSFDQIFLGNGDAKAVLGQLARGADWQELGESISLPKSAEATGRSEVARDFGNIFADALSGLKQGQWAGPVPSGFGQHLVRVRKVLVTTTPRLADIRQRVENDWRSETAASREAKAYQALLDGYTIAIEKP